MDQKPIGFGDRFQAGVRPPVSSRLGPWTIATTRARSWGSGRDHWERPVCPGAGAALLGPTSVEGAPGGRAQRPGRCRADLPLKENIGHGREAGPGSGIDLVESDEKSQDTAAIGRSVLTGIIISRPVGWRDRNRGVTKEWGGSCPGPDCDGPPSRRRRRSRVEDRGKIDPRWHRHQRGGTNGPVRGR